MPDYAVWVFMVQALLTVNGEDDVRWTPVGIYMYHVYNGTILVNFDESVTLCSGMDAHLAVAKTDRIHKDIVELIKRTIYHEEGPPYRSFYIGLRDYIGHNTNFEWSNGETLPFRQWTPMQWAEGEPNDFNNMAENCVTMGSSARIAGYKWFDVPCRMKNAFICQKKLQDQGPGSSISTYLINAFMIFVLCTIIFFTGLCNKERRKLIKQSTKAIKSLGINSEANLNPSWPTPSLPEEEYRIKEIDANIRSSEA